MENCSVHLKRQVWVNHLVSHTDVGCEGKVDGWKGREWRRFNVFVWRIYIDKYFHCSCALCLEGFVGVGFAILQIKYAMSHPSTNRNLSSILHCSMHNVGLRKYQTDGRMDDETDGWNDASRCPLLYVLRKYVYYAWSKLNT